MSRDLTPIVDDYERRLDQSLYFFRTLIGPTRRAIGGNTMGSLRSAEAAVANADIVMKVLRDVNTMEEEKLVFRAIDWLEDAQNTSEWLARVRRYLYLYQKRELVQEQMNIWHELSENWARGKHPYLSSRYDTDIDH